MCILITMAFSFLIVTPVSTVAMGLILFTNENYVGAGAATLGLVSAAAVLAIGTYRANSKGASVAILLGAIKLMMPNCARKPQLFLTILTTAAVTGLSGYFLKILGTHESAGFGIIGLIGPTKSYAMNGGNLLPILLAFFVIPFVVAFLADRLYSDILKLYKPEAYKPEQISGKYDVIFVATKSMQLRPMLESVKHLLHEDTKIICILNGLGHVETLKDYVKEENILIGVTVWTSGLGGPGILEAHGTGKIELEQVKEVNLERTLALVERFNDAGLNIKYSADTYQSIWKF